MAAAADRAMPRPGWRAALAWPAHHARAILHWVLVVAAVGYIAWEMPDLVGAVRDAGDALSRMDYTWLALAVTFAVGALLLYGELHRYLLVIGHHPVPGRTVQAITFGENAISNTVPVVGGAGALAYSITRLRARGVDTALASWAVFLPGALTSVVLLIGGVLVVGAAGWMPMWFAGLLAAAVIVGTAGFWEVLTHVAVLRALLYGVVRILNRLPWVCRSCRTGWAADPDGTAAALVARINVLHPSRRQWALLTGVAVLSWAADFLALHAVAMAVGLDAGWVALAVGFLTVQLSIALQVLPGGAGLAETGLLGVLVAAGSSPALAAATVVVYRLITWLGLSLVGWVVYALQIHLSPRHHCEDDQIGDAAPAPAAGN